MQRLNIHRLKESLDRLCNCLDDLYYINNGGCCYVASLIALHLDRLRVKYALVIYDDLPRDNFGITYEVLNMSKCKKQNCSVSGNYTCCHYCIYIEGAGAVNTASCEEDIYLDEYRIPGVSYKNIRWIYKNGLWNEDYNTRHNKSVSNMIKSFFKEYE